MRKLSKGLMGYEEQWGGLCTVKSGTYLMGRREEIIDFPKEEYYELKRLFELFERNMDKEKKGKLLKYFTRE